MTDKAQHLTALHFERNVAQGPERVFGRAAAPGEHELPDRHLALAGAQELDADTLDVDHDLLGRDAGALRLGHQISFRTVFSMREKTNPPMSSMITVPATAETTGSGLTGCGKNPARKSSSTPEYGLYV